MRPALNGLPKYTYIYSHNNRGPFHKINTHSLYLYLSHTHSFTRAVNASSSCTHTCKHLEIFCSHEYFKTRSKRIQIMIMMGVASVLQMEVVVVVPSPPRVGANERRYSAPLSQVTESRVTVHSSQFQFTIRI